MNEIYEFSFKRGQLIKVIGGILSLVVLVFCAGILTGVALQMKEPVPTLLAQSSHRPIQNVSVPAPQIAVPPPEPVVEEKPAAEVSDADQVAIDPDLPAIEEKDEKDGKDLKAAVQDSDEPLEPGIPGKFAVQLGAFLQPENAGLLAKKLEKKGYDADVVAREDSHGRTWYLVRYGIFSNRAEANATAMEIRTRENLDALVRPSNSM